MDKTKVLELLQNNPGATIVGHISPKGERCFRIRDAKQNPLANFSKAILDQLVSEGSIIKHDNLWMLNN